MPQSGIVKYHVKLSYEVDGLVERADIIGAIFGQTEGLLGPEMNLNELQRVSKVGRIEVIAKSTANTTNGNAVIPMSTDIDTCALIAAGIESIDKVGPFDCKFTLDAIDDVRAAKKDDIVKRAKEIKQKWATKTVSEGETMLNDVHQGDSVKLSSCGPSINATTVSFSEHNSLIDSSIFAPSIARTLSYPALKRLITSALPSTKIIQLESKTPELHVNLDGP